MTPTDDMAFVGYPPMIRPDADEVHISVTFTWDLPLAYALHGAWSQYYERVKIGGPALQSPYTGFMSGMYIKPNVIFTSRGCNNNCPWCLVRLYEGKFRSVALFHLDIPSNPIIQDNNILQHQPTDLSRIIIRLSKVNGSVTFSGGLDARLVNGRLVYMLQQIKIKQLFMSCDTVAALEPLEKAVKKLKHLGRDKLRCYALLAFNGESIEAGKERLEAIWQIGCLPFAQLYQPPDRYIKYSLEWRGLARMWSRPAITKAICRGEL